MAIQIGLYNVWVYFTSVATVVAPLVALVTAALVVRLYSIKVTALFRFFRSFTNL
jgi:hypothetical protein